MNVRFPLVAVCGTAAFLAAATPAYGQLADPRPVETTTVTLGLEKPFFERSGMGAGTLVLRGDVAFPLGGVTGFVRLGMARATHESLAASTALASPVIGVIMPVNRSARFEVSALLPLGSDDADSFFAAGVGVLSDAARVDGFLPDVLGFTGAFAADRGFDAGGEVGVRLGASFLAPEGDNALAFRYGVHGSLPLGAVRAGAELAGHRFVIPRALEGDLHTLTVSAGLPAVTARPSLFVRLPLDDDLSEALSAVVGVSVTF